ncbi:transaldolase family protein [Lyngbya sp. CCY1209]|uniref:transaldolase family protein n=1 Tax=Lyngbya sp. CCY1209 TaxID=2886103 RepID=UPI002D764B53|nr:transaldolase family protein [Lyngbya sp. CCY1209]
MDCLQNVKNRVELREMTVVVADTGDIKAIETFTPTDAATNPSLMTAAAAMPEYQGIVDDTLKRARQELGAGASARNVAALAARSPRRVLRVENPRNHPQPGFHGGGRPPVLE